MSKIESYLVETTVVEEQVRFTLEDFSRACEAEVTQVIVFVEEGVLEPSGNAPSTWIFTGNSLRRARAASRLMRDLELPVSSAALVLDLLDEIESLRARLKRVGAG